MQLSNSGKIIILIWIPSHIGIRGNELADEAAKSAINLSMSAVKCPATDLYSYVANVMCIFSSRFTKFFDKNPTHVHPLGLRVSGDLSDIGFTQKNNLVTSVSSTPPWHLVTPTVDLSLNTLSKSVTSPEIYLSKFLEICEGLQDYYLSLIHI